MRGPILLTRKDTSQLEPLLKALSEGTTNVKTIIEKLSPDDFKKFIVLAQSDPLCREKIFEFQNPTPLEQSYTENTRSPRHL